MSKKKSLPQFVSMVCDEDEELMLEDNYNYLSNHRRYNSITGEYEVLTDAGVWEVETF